MSTNDRSAAVLLERAITHLIITDHQYLRLYGRILDKRMFLEPLNYAFISAAADLLSEGTLTKLNLLERLEGQGLEKIEDHYVLQASSISGSSSFPKHYSAWIEHAKPRFIDNANQAIDTEGMSSSELISKRLAVLEQARALGIPDGGITTEAALLAQFEWMEYLRSIDGSAIISTGYRELDQNIIGFVPGTMSVIAARPSGGKTTLATLLALSAEKAGPVLFNTLEMAPGRLAFKAAALANGENPIRYDRAFEVAGVEYEAIKKRVMTQRALNIRYTSIQDPFKLESSILSLKPSLVIWDYLQLMATPSKYSGRRSEYIGEVARHFQKTAVSCSVPMVILAQLNREGDGGSASLSNIKDSGVIEEAADNVLFLERPFFEERGGDQFKADYSIKKARSGFTGAKVELLLNPETGNFDRWNSTHAVQLAEKMGL